MLQVVNGIILISWGLGVFHDFYPQVIHNQFTDPHWFPLFLHTFQGQTVFNLIQSFMA
jgi:hypothetical protein